MNILILNIIFPLISFIVLAFSQNKWSKKLTLTIGIGSVSLVALVTTYIGINFIKNGYKSYVVDLWTWMSVDRFNIDFSLALDSLSMTMLSMVACVGLLIHLFSSWYMRGQEGISRFLAYTNLFVANMIILVLADNLILMYVGWEGVGLCSYLLINFYHTDPKNGVAAIKAFVMTRVGDVFLALALFALYNALGTLNFQEILAIAPKHFKADDNVLWWITLMLLGSAVGKSAQLPLQTWLPDAMVGPTPVSALIHAATMVAAGVYLLARTNVLFLMSPEILHLTGTVGAITLVLASLTALTQTNIKRILAYSTMSQIGYMFLALGAQAWNAAIFHLITHAFFKALLFLSSGSLILFCNHEQNIFKMGGLYKSIPLIYTCFLIGGSALTALPLITSGFFSKEKILADAMVNGHTNLVLAGLVGAFITSLYTFRMIFIVFHGKEQILTNTKRKCGIDYYLPLITLMILTIFAGIIKLPLQDVLPDTNRLKPNYTLMLEIISSAISISGTLIAAWLWLGKRTLVNTISNSILGRLFDIWCYNSWGIDWLYKLTLIKPFLKIAWLLKCDPINAIMNIPVVLSHFASKGLLLSENGYLRWYITHISIGVLIMLLLIIMLH